MKLILFFLIAFCHAGQAQSQQPSAPVLYSLDENGFDALREESKGKVLVLNFWATWCVPCVEEFPELLKLQRAYRNHGLDVIFVSIDDDAKARQKVMAFLAKMKVAGRSYIKQTEDDEKFINAVHPKWSGAVPTTLVYDAKGRLAEINVGQLNFFELDKIVKPLLSN